VRSIVLFLSITIPCVAGGPSKDTSSLWRAAPGQRVLHKSAWSKTLRVGSTQVEVRWESARPVQAALAEAHVKGLSIGGQPCYAIAVIGLPSTAGGGDAFLKATGRALLSAYSVSWQDDAVVFLFPRSALIAEPVIFRFPFGLKIGNHVAFRARIGGVVIRQKFSLRAMSKGGVPEL